MKPQLKSIITKTKSWRLRRSTKAKCIIYKSHCGCQNHSWTVVQLISVKIGRSGTLISHMNLKKHYIITVNKSKMYNLQIPLWLSQPLMDGRAIAFSQNWQKRNLNFTYEFKKASHYNR